MHNARLVAKINQDDALAHFGVDMTNNRKKWPASIIFLCISSLSPPQNDIFSNCQPKRSRKFASQLNYLDFGGDWWKGAYAYKKTLKFIAPTSSRNRNDWKSICSWRPSQKDTGHIKMNPSMHRL